MTPTRGPLFVWFLYVAFTCNANAQDKYFHIQVVDKETGRGVPLGELTTVNNIRYIADSAGNIAFSEPGLMDQEVFFHVAGHGYEYPKDGFGNRGRKLKTMPGTKATIKVTRKNLAERLYRITGGGIYRDTVLLGLEPPIKQPMLNGKVVGCDSVVNALYRDRLYWFWGDTNRPAYPLGNFQVTGAISALPENLDPAKGIDLQYFVNAETGFARQMAPVPGKGPTWIFGTMVVPDATGRERLLAKYAKIKAPLTVYERGLVLFDDGKEQFEKFVEFDLDALLFPDGQSFVKTESDGTYIYFATPFPLVRVKADFDLIQKPESYQAYSYFQAGVRIEKDDEGKLKFDADDLDRGSDGKLRLNWRHDAHPLSPRTEQALINQKLIKPEEAYTLIRDVDSGKRVLLSSGSVAWNEYRQKWIMIAVQVFGSSMLGEIWYAEADDPTGPWTTAQKIVSHNNYSFYNPRHHPYFDQQGGRVIYFEGTYTKWLSGAKLGTPRYDYNQIMYRLDLDKVADN